MVSHPRGIVAAAHIMTMPPIDEIQKAMAELRRDGYRRARACLCRQREATGLAAANVKRRVSARAQSGPAWPVVLAYA